MGLWCTIPAFSYYEKNRTIYDSTTFLRSYTLQTFFFSFSPCSCLTVPVIKALYHYLNCGLKGIDDSRFGTENFFISCLIFITYICGDNSEKEGEFFFIFFLGVKRYLHYFHCYLNFPKDYNDLSAVEPVPYLVKLHWIILYYN